MNDRTKHIKPKAWMAFALLLFPLLHGCITINPYYENVAQYDTDYPDWAEWGGYYYRMQGLLASLTDEQREIYEREKEAVEVKGVPESALFVDVYHQGYKEGYAYCKATKYLHCRYVIAKAGPDKGSSIMVHFLGTYEKTPLHEAYGQGWDDGQDAAFDRDWLRNRE